MCICITIENESLRCLERSKVEKDTTAVSFSAGMDLCFEKDLMDWTAVHFDEVMGEAACAEKISSDFMDWTAIQFDEVVEVEWMEVHFDEDMEFEVEEGEDVEMEDQEIVMDFEFD
jgi:hypothetical protein